MQEQMLQINQNKPDFSSPIKEVNSQQNSTYQMQSDQPSITNNQFNSFYQKQLEFQLQKDKKLYDLQLQKELEINTQLQEKPNITPKSQVINLYKNYTPIHQRSIEYQQLKDQNSQNLIDMVKKREEEELKQLPFRPKINNDKSASKIISHNASSNKITKVYDKNMEWQKKLNKAIQDIKDVQEEQMQTTIQNQNFKANKKSANILDKSYMNQMDFQERQLNYNKRRKERQQSIENQMNNQFRRPKSCTQNYNTQQYSGFKILKNRSSSKKKKGFQVVHPSLKKQSQSHHNQSMNTISSFSFSPLKQSKKKDVNSQSFSNFGETLKRLRQQYEQGIQVYQFNNYQQELIQQQQDQDQQELQQDDQDQEKISMQQQKSDQVLQDQQEDQGQQELVEDEQEEEEEEQKLQQQEIQQGIVEESLLQQSLHNNNEQSIIQEQLQQQQQNDNSQLEQSLQQQQLEQLSQSLQNSQKQIIDQSFQGSQQLQQQKSQVQENSQLEQQLDQSIQQQQVEELQYESQQQQQQLQQEQQQQGSQSYLQLVPMVNSQQGNQSQQQLQTYQGEKVSVTSKSNYTRSPNKKVIQNLNQTNSIHIQQNFYGGSYSSSNLQQAMMQPECINININNNVDQLRQDQSTSMLQQQDQQQKRWEEKYRQQQKKIKKMEGDQENQGHIQFLQQLIKENNQQQMGQTNNNNIMKSNPSLQVNKSDNSLQQQQQNFYNLQQQSSQSQQSYSQQNLSQQQYQDYYQQQYMQQESMQQQQQQQQNLKNKYKSVLKSTIQEFKDCLDQIEY